MWSSRGRSTRPPRPSDRGAAAVEFALVLPLLLLLVFGIIDFGRMLNARITLTEAAREGARAAALQNRDQGIARANWLTDAIGGTRPPTINDCASRSTVQAEAVLEHDFRFVTPIGFMAGFMSGSNSTVRMVAKGAMPCLH